MDSDSKSVEAYLKEPEIHRQWERAYRTAENEAFYERAFDYLAQKINAPENAAFLDAGCGSGSHSIRLAKRGFQVQAVDFSQNVLSLARENVKDMGLESKIKIQRQDICALSFDSESFPFIVSWGVLMHVPNFEKALGELVRVLKPGGILVLSENNMDSLEAKLIRMFKKGKTRIKKSPSGLEFWRSHDSGELVVRLTHIPWLIEKLSGQGLTLKERIAGQFSEAYARFSSPCLQNLFHNLNKFWFKYFKKNPRPAFGNILIFQKTKR
ncbi:MAG: class I SAM-dependent methyltransferase [Nitrospinales bacterium]